MHKNAFWVGFLLIVVVLALWFIIKGGYDLINYYSLNTSAEVKIEEWRIEEISEGSYSVIAHFIFEHEGTRVKGASRVGELYPNAYAAETGLKRMAQQRAWVAWYNLSDPEGATLQKKFPFKSLISAIILFTLLIYFIALGRYVVLRGQK